MTEEEGGGGEVVSPVAGPEADRPPETPPQRIAPIPIAMITMAIGVAVFLAASIVGSLLNFAVSAAIGQVSLLATTVVVLRLSRRSVTRFTGLVGSKPRAFVVGAFVGVGNSLLIAGPLMFLSRELFPEWILKMFDLTELLSRIDFLPVEKWGLAITAVVMAPVIEELMFRGLFFNSLARWRPGWAAVISAVVFSAYHLDPVGFLARFEMGLMLAWLFWRTRSLGACIGAHAANNLLAVVGVAASQGKVDPTEPVTFSGWLVVGGIGALLMVPAVLVMLRSESSSWATPADDPETPKRSFFAEVLPWATGMVLALAIVLKVDYRGAQLSIIDVTSPVKDASEHEREVLKQLRRGARDGRLPINAYVELRRELSKKVKP